ncbi:uncharacterized protein F4812DRAFT_447445 [Daldinia caldariorum]|uniref:uncharacterized protein n=1 Tax=Daldinia caldariorum TaxID=326644 RepID=UPI002008CC25|nr:uncharacterized protein F4812DRAFT_447445 [Daldinia caldariorum]KAI1463201.1 hypothetical protein F4812DRAFT_447445 [Daldinia caldariorum]
MFSCLWLKNMATPRQSNVERGRWRMKCRDRLSQHIEERLGINIPPSQVRLQSTRNDGYAWQVLPEKQHLFSKNLSDHSVGAYRDLCEGVGVTFEAVRATPESYTGQGAFNPTEPAPPSFASRINELQVQNDYLNQQLNFLKFQLEAEIKLRLDVEERQKSADERFNHMREKFDAATRREGHFRSLALRYSQGFSKMIPIINNLQEDPGITEEGYL